MHCGIVDIVFILGVRDKKQGGENENGVSNENDLPLPESIHEVAEAGGQTQSCHLTADQVDRYPVRNVVFRGIVLLIRLVEYRNAILHR